MYTACSVIMMVLVLHSTSGRLFNMEAEDFAVKTSLMFRSEASGNFSALFKEGNIPRVNFCLRKASVVYIHNVVYSNDGGSDTVSVLVDGANAGTFVTLAFPGNGRGWNRFRSTGPLNPRLTLGAGRHVMSLNISKTDRWGVEIDYVLLSISDQAISISDLKCNVYCFHDITHDDIYRGDATQGARFVQKSVSTACAEEDNVKVELYHENATTFELVANLPKYLSFANNKDAIYDNCVMGSPFWMFNNVSVSPSATVVSKTEAMLVFGGSQRETILTVEFNFEKLTVLREVDEAQLGSVLLVRLRNMPNENVYVRPRYIGNSNQWVVLQAIEFTPFETQKAWTIPDNEFTSTSRNKIELTIKQDKQSVVVDTVRLDRRDTADRTFDMFADSDVVIQGVALDFWHRGSRHQDSMTVQLVSGNTTAYTAVDSLRIYRHIPWTGGYSQVFVIFQDGRTRLQTITPHGLDYVPFGSSVNIGQPTSTSSRKPYSPIKKITVNPTSLELMIAYENKNSATFRLETTYSYTKLTVSRVRFLQPRARFPILTFQSMWIADGDADVDSVRINGDVSRHIMSDWREMIGVSAVFFRKCISRHNTQGPDLKITFLPS